MSLVETTLMKVEICVIYICERRIGMYIPEICVPEICIEIGRTEFGISGIGVFEIYIEFGLGETCDWGTCILEIGIEIGLVEIYISELVEIHLFEICPEMGPGPSSSESTS